MASGAYTGAGDQVVLVERSAVLAGGWNRAYTAQEGLSTVDGQGARLGISVASGATVRIERFFAQRSPWLLATGLVSGNHQESVTQLSPALTPTCAIITPGGHPTPILPQRRVP